MDEYQLVVTGERIIEPESGYSGPGTVYIKDDSFFKVERERPSEKQLKELANLTRLIDATGLIVGPGLIDMHVHLREPGREDEETILTGAEAAAAGGFTSICCMPNTTPPLDNYGIINFVVERARSAKVRVYPIGAITQGQKGEIITEIGDLVEAGAVAISDDGYPVMNSGVMRNAMEYARMFDIPIISHPEDLGLVGSGVANEGFNSTRFGLSGIPGIAEEVMVARDIMISEFTRCALHLAHLSTAGSISLVKEAKSRKVAVSCEVTPHHFTLTDDLLESYDSNLRVNPPIRTKGDVEAVKEGLKDGIVDVIASDHAPHSQEEKEVEFQAAPCGMIGLETTVGLVVTELVEKGIIDWMEFFKKLSLNPATILKLQGGRLQVNAPADLTIIDPKKRWVVDPKRFKSKSRNSPFIGRRLKGKAKYTVVAGKVVFEAES
ncbi:MAG: dihydroorotase [candidate division Zixibacteria bacterium DG_27]|nr:MAG: dihydroorotase [candidate division Zixibacteria bacterium DG_27]